MKNFRFNRKQVRLTISCSLTFGFYVWVGPCRRGTNKKFMLSFYYFIEAFLKLCPNVYRYVKPDPYLGHSFDDANFVMIMCFYWSQAGTLPFSIGGDRCTCSSCLTPGPSVPHCQLSGWTLLPLYIWHTGGLPAAEDVCCSRPEGQLWGNTPYQTKL